MESVRSLELAEGILSWGFNKTYTPSAYTVAKSTDKGVNFADVAIIPFDTSATGGSYQRARQRFFWLDAEAAPGDIYRVTADAGPPEFLVAPPALELCHVYGYVYDGFGHPATKTRVTVRSYSPVGVGAWAPSDGLAAQEPAAIAIQGAEQAVIVDATGLWKVALVRRTHAQITCEELGLDIAFEVPDREGPVNVRDLVRLRQADPDGQWSTDGRTKGRPLVG